MKRFAALAAFVALLFPPPTLAQAPGQMIAPPTPPALPAAAPAGTTDVLARIKRTGVMRVGLTGDYKPFSYLNPSTGAFTGADVDAAQSLARSIGPTVKVQIVKTTWPTMTADLVADKFDIAMGGVSRSPDRVAAGTLSHTYFVDGKVALVRKADVTKYATLAAIDQPGVTVIDNPGGTNQKFVDANLKNAHVVTVDSNLAIPGMIASGKGDVMITDGVEAALAAKRDARLAVANPNAPFTRVEKVYYYQKNQPGLDAAVDAWVDTMQASTKPYGTLVDQWISAFASIPDPS